MRYTLSDIQQILGATWLQQSAPNAPVEQLLFDSRQVAAPAVSLFFALPGKRHDGHRYLTALYEQGVRQFIVSQSVDLKNLPEANILKVENTLDALQCLAAWHRAQFNIPIIGITGSNGKTVVKEWLHQLLAPDFHIVRSPKSYNSQIGVPLSVWQMDRSHTLAIFEAGISQPGEMQRLAHIVRPTIGVFTNLGPAHQEGFSSDAEKFLEKMRLFEGAAWLVCKAENRPVEFGGKVLAWSSPSPEGRGVASLRAPLRRETPLPSGEGLGEESYLQILDIQSSKSGETQISGIFQDAEPTEISHISIPFSDAASVENAIHCWVVLRSLGIAQASIEARTRRLDPVEMRLELKAGIRRCTLVNDFYNNDLASLRIALQFARQQARSGPLTLILSDILQSGLPSAALWAQVAEAIRGQQVGRLIGIGDEIPAIQALLPAGFDARFFRDTDRFLKSIQNEDFCEETILLKGARVFEFERIARRLEQKAHKTMLEINLTALVHNLNVYNKLLRPGVKMMAMVKAAGYGAGSAEVAKLLEFHQVDYLGVAYADEGIELRQAGVRLPILVLNPEPASFDALYRYRLEPEVYSLPMLEEVAHFAGGEKPLAIHLKLDTGMHRLGFEPVDIERLVEKLQASPNLRIQSVFSHLAASDAAQHDAFTHQQAAVFSAMTDQIAAALGYAPLRHLCNTGGIARFPQYHFDMVRLGIGLYGIDGTGLQPQLRTVNVLKATISQIKEIAPGDTVGYNRNSGPLAQPTRIATISIGYADGFLRLAGGGRYAVQVRGQLAPTVGNVCMDMTMVDVTRIPTAREGDEVIVFGENPPVQALADCLQTIPYEVFTNISERVKRVYWSD
jgi:alanine racemase